jgi:hypothetical protein
MLAYYAKEWITAIASFIAQAPPWSSETFYGQLIIPNR